MIKNFIRSNTRSFGAIMLVAGSCVGAGMLGLPMTTAPAGYLPTFATFIVSWFFMTLTGLLLLEINLGFKEETSFSTMAEKTLGRAGQILSWVLFTFLFYSLMVAYIAGSGQLLRDFAENFFAIRLPENVAAGLLLLLFAILIYRGTKLVDHFNRFLMLGLATAYFVMTAAGLPHVKTEYLLRMDFAKAPLALPTMIISFGFHNLIPSLSSYLKHDRKKLRRSIILGSLTALAIYMLFEAVILGLVPVEGGLKEALLNQDMATRALRKAVDSSWVVEMAEYFAFFAIVTTLLTVSLSFVDFFADGLKIEKKGLKKSLLCLLTMGPPFVFAIIYPRIFLTALSYAGAFGAVTLFGIMPTLMLLAQKKRSDIPGGRITLIMVILFSLLVIAAEIYKKEF